MSRGMQLQDDPFEAVLRPPSDETPQEKAIRLQREAEARRVSAAIDESIKAERQQRKKRRTVHLLLLGQSESGKSTTLRQFQRIYTPTAFREERILWRAVIQLNVVRSIHTIIDALALSGRPKSHRIERSFRSRRKARARDGNQPDDDHSVTPSGSPRTGPSSPVDSGEDSDSEPPLHSIMHHAAFTSHIPQSPPRRHAHAASDDHWAASITALTARLLPLRHIEALLIARLVPEHETEPTNLGFTGYDAHSRSGPSEVFVRPGPCWNGKLTRAIPRPTNGTQTEIAEPDEPQAVLYQCRRDMMALWADPGVRDVLHRKKIRLQESSGFFLNDLERIASQTYLPNDEDVLRARLKTIGVSEYRFEMEAAAGRESGAEWRIVDVGGSRSQRPTWMPFFDGVDAIIFLAPISGFDQVLTEDRRANRLEDSFLLWKALCSNKLLARVDLVLFLNKCDILEAKLNAGIRLAKYLKSYGERENDLENVSKYLRGKFGAIHREYSPSHRNFYAFCTSVTDTTTTAGIIASVRDVVSRQHLKQSRMLI